MSMITEYLEPCFAVAGFGDSFIALNQLYSSLDFKDEISDNERIAEYKWITQQLRKYIGKQKEVILSHKNREEILAEIENLISKTSEYGDNRKEIAYNIMRDDFLAQLHNIVELYEEEEYDG